MIHRTYNGKQRTQVRRLQIAPRKWSLSSSWPIGEDRRERMSFMFYNGANYNVPASDCQTYGALMPVIFIFLDGVGLAPASPHNPLATARMPALHTLLGGPLTSEQIQERVGLRFHPIDATLGVAGLPQSGTGHVALLTGVNAPALVGRHQPYYPPVALRPLLAEQSLFHLVQARGLRPAFANAFTPGYWSALASRRLRRTASVIAAEGAGVYLRGPDDLRAGRAVTWDITNEWLHGREPDLNIPIISAWQAGERLAALAHDYDLVFFECFLPDLAGHGRLAVSVEMVFERIDGMLGGVLAALRPTDTLLVTSDHGNVEDNAAAGHTRNPVPLLAVGAAAQHFATVTDCAGVTPAILAALS